MFDIVCIIKIKLWDAPGETAFARMWQGSLQFGHALFILLERASSMSEK